MRPNAHASQLTRMPTRRVLCRSAVFLCPPLFRAPWLKAQNGDTRKIRIGGHSLAVPLSFVSSDDSTGVSVASVWPDMTGAMGPRGEGASFPPRAVLNISWSLRPSSSTIAEEAPRSSWRPWPKNGTETVYGLKRLNPRKLFPGTVILTDDPSNPTLFVRYSLTDGGASETWCILEFDIHDMRAYVSLFGALLPQWRDIRTRVTALYFSFLAD
jgi:hypothetical protein